MITVIKNEIDMYKEAYRKEKCKNEYYKLLIKKQEKKLKQFEEENKAYKILLEDKLNKEE